MGNLWSDWMVELGFAKRECRILMLGLDASGKTTILYRLKLGNAITTIPTIGFNVETVEYKKMSFTVWDVGGQQKIRPLWRHYYANASALIFVVDSADKQRIEAKDEDDIDSAQHELHEILLDSQLDRIPVLVLANKQDVPKAASVSEVAEKLKLKQLTRRHAWHIQGCVAPTGEGLYEGLEWLSKQLSLKKE